MDADPDVAGAISALQAALRDRQSPRLDRTTAASIAAHRGGEQHAAVVLSRIGDVARDDELPGSWVGLDHAVAVPIKAGIEPTVRQAPARCEIVYNFGYGSLGSRSAVCHPDIAIQSDRRSAGTVCLVGGQERDASVGAAQTIHRDDAVIPSHLVAGLGIKLGDRARARVGNPGEVKRGAVVAQDDSAVRTEGDSIPGSIRSTIQHEVTRAVVVGNAAVKRGSAIAAPVGSRIGAALANLSLIGAAAAAFEGSEKQTQPRHN